MILISVILTVLNEGESIRRLLDSLAAQTRKPDEIVIADGYPDKMAMEFLKEAKIRVRTI